MVSSTSFVNSSSLPRKVTSSALKQGRRKSRKEPADASTEKGTFSYGSLCSIALFSFSRSDTAAVRISFSLALVMATYKIRISSDKASSFSFVAITFFRSVLLLIRSLLCT